MATLKDLQTVAGEWLDAYELLHQPDYSDEREVIEALEAYQAMAGRAHYLAMELLKLNSDEPQKSEHPRYMGECLDTETVYRCYRRETLTDVINAMLFQTPAVVTWQITDNHSGQVVAGDASFSRSVLAAIEKRKAHQPTPPAPSPSEQLPTPSPAPYILLNIRYSDCAGLFSWVSIRAGTISNAIDIYADLLNSNKRRVLFWSITTDNGAELMANTIPYEAYDDENTFPYRDQQIQRMREQAHEIEQLPTPPAPAPADVKQIINDELSKADSHMAEYYMLRSPKDDNNKAAVVVEALIRAMRHMVSLL